MNNSEFLNNLRIFLNISEFFKNNIHNIIHSVLNYRKYFDDFMNKTFVMIKPDAVRRGLIGKIINRFEENGLTILAMNAMEISKELAETHYTEHKGKEFYDRLIDFITSGMAVTMILAGDESVVSFVREIVGATNPAKAKEGTIRGDFKENPVKSVTENMVHASDSNESSKREITLFFGEKYL